MSISAAGPYRPLASTPVLREVFAAHGINDNKSIRIASGAGAGKDAGNAERFDFTPGAVSLRQKVMNIITRDGSLDKVMTLISRALEDGKISGKDAYDIADHLCAKGYRDDAKLLAAHIDGVELKTPDQRKVNAEPALKPGAAPVQVWTYG